MFNATEFMNEFFGTLHLLVDEEGTIWFIGREVTDKLGYAGANNSGRAITSFVRAEDRKALKYKAFSTTEKAILWSNPNDFSDKWIINECGLYDLLMHSEAKFASDFQHWVTHEVLPSIRKNGGYVLGQEDLEADTKEELEDKIRYLASEVKRLKESVMKKNIKLREMRDEVQINRYCAKKYREALDKIDAMTELFLIEDRYNEYLRKKDIERDEMMQVLRHQLCSLRILVLSSENPELIKAAKLENTKFEEALVEQVLSAANGAEGNMYKKHGTNVFLW